MWVAIVIAVIMCLYPPFAYKSEDGRMIDRGYNFIASQRGLVQINTSRLIIQLFVIGILATGIIVTIKKTSNEENIKKYSQSEDIKLSENSYKIDTTEKKQTSHLLLPDKKESFSWKTLIISVFIAAFLNVIISSFSEIEPRKNIVWTSLWIYLSIQAWKLWKWKSLIPYPLFVVLNILAIAAINPSSEIESTLFGLMFNFLGLVTFYQLIKNSKEKSI